MKVNGTHRPLQLDSVKDRRTRAKSSKDAPQTERTTQVTVSTEARALAAARAPEAPDQSRIDRLKAAIVAGEFQIDVDAIADRMMSEER